MRALLLAHVEHEVCICSAIDAGREHVTLECVECDVVILDGGVW